MLCHIIIDHPWTGSFNHAVLTAFSEGLRERGHTLDVLDLHKAGFNPVMSEEELKVYSEGKSLDPLVADCQARLMVADHLVMVFPIWWNVMPARMKGWMDKVLLPGFAFTKDAPPKPMLKHIHGATVLTTTVVADAVHREEYHQALQWVLCKGTLKFCGITPVEWLNFGGTGVASQAEHDAWLAHIRAKALKLSV